MCVTVYQCVYRNRNKGDYVQETSQDWNDLYEDQYIAVTCLSVISVINSTSSPAYDIRRFSQDTGCMVIDHISQVTNAAILLEGWQCGAVCFAS